MIKIVRKKESSAAQSVLLRIVSVLAALLAAALLIALLGYNPAGVYQNIVLGAVGSKYRFQETISKTIPLVLLSLGISVAFKMKFMNIGAEGQFYLGAMAAAFVALFCRGLPAPLVLPLMAAAAAAAGTLWCLIPAALKLKFGTSETLVTLMMNYIAVKWVSYLQYGPWEDPRSKGFPRIAKFAQSAVLPKVFGIHIGWIIALVFVVLVYLLMSRTKLGYEISVLGENANTAKYAGINIVKVALLSAVISGGLCGLAGMVQASGVEHSLTDQLSGGLGYTSIITAWLADLSAPAILVVSFFFAILLQGSSYIQSSMQIPAAVAEVLQGIIIFFVLASEFHTQYRFVRVRRAAGAEKEAQ